MQFSTPDIAIQARPETVREHGKAHALKMIFNSDPALLAHSSLVIPLLGAGIAFHLTALQWFLVLLVTFISVICGIFRAAAILQSKRDLSLTDFHVRRIRVMGNAIAGISLGISFLTYLLIFIPAILQSF